MKLERKFKILKCIVEEYIKTAQPVGSENLLKNYDLKCSSATIRNAMASLEEEGYLEKTHVSSGRVPSLKGYQHYLEHLDRNKSLDTIDMEFQRKLVRYLSDPTLGVDEFISNVCQVLSDMTEMVTVLLKPDVEEKIIKLELIPLNNEKVLGLFITDKGTVESKSFLLNKTHFFDVEKAVKFVYLLSKTIDGMSLHEVLTYIEDNHKQIEDEFGYVGIICLTALKEALLKYCLSSNNKWKIFGKYNLFNQNEYSSDPEAIVSVLEALSDPSLLQHSFVSSDDLGNVKISFTNDRAGDLVVVSKTIHNSNEQVSIIGPKRMDYQKILSSLDYICYLIDSFINGSKAKEGSMVLFNCKSEKESKKKKRKESNK